MSETFLTASDVALLLKISRALAYRLLASGQIPAVKFGRSVRVREADLRRFIDESTVGSRDPAGLALGVIDESAAGAR